MSDKKKFDPTPLDPDATSISSTDLQYILSINNKAIQIYVEVERQNEEIIENLDNLKEFMDELKEKINNLSNDSESIKKTLEEDLVEYEKKSRELLDKIQSNLQYMSMSNATAATTITNGMATLMTEFTSHKEELKKIDKIEKHLYRLDIILGSSTVLAILSLVAKILFFK